MSVREAGDLTVELLGPVRATVGGEPVQIGGPKQQAVLAVLALAHDRSCSADQLAAALWGADIPASAAGTLRAYVSRLRSALPDGAIERTAAGWRLRVARDHVDALRVQDLLDEASDADPAVARRLLAEALFTWRGEALEGLSALPFAGPHRERLADLRADASERLLALRLAAGEHREVVHSASALAAQHPYREGPVTHLALALARSGRHADALAAVEQLRARLVDDLGLDPSPQLLQLHRRLLLHDPDVVAPATSVAGTGPGGTHLPLPLTSFVGRDRDIAAVHEALAAARLVTLVGPGGAGKTRLALEALRRLGTTAGVDGPWLVELGHVSDPARVVDSVAQALVVTTTAAGDPRLIADAVRGRRLLLVLDNCEHVVDQVADLVAHLLAACGGVQVLATSREALGVAGERVHRVDPLPRGHPGAPGEAELLFAERAASVVSGFRLDGKTAGPVSRLVRALDGIPLAVELAAARLAVMGLDDMLAMLDDRFSLLEGGARTSLPHQRTLAAAIRWSHDLLEPQERRLFGIASTFAGPFTLAALRGLAEEELARPVVGLLASLTAKSMIQVEPVQDTRDSRSYRLLETMRVFGRSTVDPAARQRLAGRHAQWFADDAAEAYPHLRGPGAQRWLAHLDVVRPDMRAALRHAVEQQDRATALRLVGGLSMYWFHRGHVREGLDWLAVARSLPGTADEVTEGRAVVGAALLAYACGDAVTLDPTVLHGLARAASTAADPSTAAVAAVYAGYFHAAFGSLEDAHAHFARAEELVGTGTVDAWAVAEVLFAQGQLLRAQGRRLEALDVLRQAARTAQECGHEWAAGSSRYIAAKVHLDMRQGAPALDLVAGALPACLELGIHTSTLALLHVAGAAAALVERHRQAAALLGAVDAWGERFGYHPERMDPVDAEYHRSLVREGMVPAELQEAQRHGRELSLGAAAGLVADLAGTVARRSRRRV